MFTSAHLVQLESFVSHLADSRDPRGPYRAFKKKKSEVSALLRGMEKGIPKPGSRLVKSRALQILLSYLFHLDLRRGKYSRYAIDTYTCYKLQFSSRILMMLGAKGIGISLARKGLKLAEAQQNTECIISFLNELRRHASTTGDLASHQRLSADLLKSMELQSAEFRAFAAYEALVLEFAQTTSPRPELGHTARSLANEIKPILERVSSTELQLGYYRLRALSDQISLDFESAIASCEDAVSFVDSSSGVNPTRKIEFLLKQLVCSLHACKYNEAVALAKRIGPLFKVNSPNWLLVKEYELLSYFQLSDWQNAQSVLIASRTSPVLGVSSDLIQERWNLYSMYFELVNPQGVQQGIRAQVVLGHNTFKRMSRAFAKDKAGLHFSLLLLRVLIQIRNRAYGSASTLIQSLVVYSSNYLRETWHTSAAELVELLKRLNDNHFVHNQYTAMLLSHERSLGIAARQTSAFKGHQILPILEIINLIETSMQSEGYDILN